MTPILSPWARPEPKKKPASKTLCQRVLVVEDELVIGAIAAEALENAGYEVFTAASAEEAEIILRDVSVDVLFTDINLGGQDGFELAQAALSLQPLLSVILTSGRSRIGHGMCKSAGVPFLAKPYRLTELLATIEGVLKGATTQ
jgi:DNA-binding response OmpR family regulator